MQHAGPGPFRSKRIFEFNVILTYKVEQFCILWLSLPAGCLGVGYYCVFLRNERSGFSLF